MQIKNWTEIDFSDKKPFILNEVGNGFVSRRIQLNSVSKRPVEERFTHTASLCLDYSDRRNNQRVIIESHFKGYKNKNGCNKVPVIDWFKRAKEKSDGVFLFKQKSINEGRLSAFCELGIKYDLRGVLRHKLHNILGISKFADANEKKVYCTELIALCDNWEMANSMRLDPHELIPEDLYLYAERTDKVLYDLTDIPLDILEQKLYA